MSLRFEGYAALWNRVDRAGDVMRAGAFAGAATVPLLWQHRGMPIGAVRVGEDAIGLRVEGHVEAIEAAQLVRRGVLAGLSVGYRARRVRQGVRREILAAELVEVSLVAVPMQPLARVDVIS